MEAIYVSTPLTSRRVADYSVDLLSVAPLLPPPAFRWPDRQCLQWAGEDSNLRATDYESGDRPNRAERGRTDPPPFLEIRRLR